MADLRELAQSDDFRFQDYLLEQIERNYDFYFRFGDDFSAGAAKAYDEVYNVVFGHDMEFEHMMKRVMEAQDERTRNRD